MRLYRKSQVAGTLDALSATYLTPTTSCSPPHRYFTCAASASVSHPIYTHLYSIPLHLCCVSLCISSLLHTLVQHPTSPVLCQPLYLIPFTHTCAASHFTCAASASVSHHFYTHLCSIPLHLCCVSVDRYVAITDPFNYDHKMTPRFVAWLLAGVWTVSALVSHLPIHLGWYAKDAEQLRQSDIELCLFEVNQVCTCNSILYSLICENDDVNTILKRFTLPNASSKLFKRFLN